MHTTFRIRPSAIALAILLLGPPVSRAELPPYYTVTRLLSPIGDPLGVRGVAINDLGAVVGDNGQRPFLWNGQGSFSWLAQTGQAQVFGLNNAGVAFGQGTVLLQGQPLTVAMRWDNGTPSVLSPPDANGVQTSGSAQGINQQGWIVGRNAATGGPLQPLDQGLLWSPAGQPTALPGGFVPTAINGLNTVAGAVVVAGQPAPALWSAGGGLQLLPSPLGTRGSLIDINDQGQVVGGYSRPDGIGVDAFRWDAQGGLQPLGAPQGAVIGSVYGMNGQGVVVGASRFVDNSHGFGFPFDGRANPLAWAPGAAGPVNLATRARMADGSLLADANLWWAEAVDINARGQVLVNNLRFYTDYLNQPQLAGFETFILSPCIRCGQINPNPNPSGASLIVGSDWVDAFNGVAYDNRGGLLLATAVVNRVPGTLRNSGNLGLAFGATLTNDGVIENRAGALFFIDGTLDNRSGEVVNHGGVVLRDGGSLVLSGPSWTNQPLSSFMQQGGTIENSARFSATSANLLQEAGSFANGATGEVLQQGGSSTFGGSVTNRGSMRFSAHPVTDTSETVHLRVLGVFDNLGSGIVALEAGGRASIEAGGQLNSAGSLQLTGAGSKLQAGPDGTLRLQAGASAGTLVESNAVLEVHGVGAQLQMDHGAKLTVGGQGSLFLRQGATGAVRGTVTNRGAMALGSGAVLEVSGRLENDGMLQLRGAGTELRVLADAPGGASPGVLGNLDHGEIEISEHALLQVGGQVTLKGQMTTSTGGRVVVDGGQFSVFGAVTGDGSFEQLSGRTFVLGLLAQSTMRFSGGTVGGVGTLRGHVVFSNGVQPDSTLRVEAGNSPGTLTIDGNLRIEGNVELELEVADYRTFDRLVVTGTTEITDFATVRAVFTPTAGYVPDLNDSFAWLVTGAGSSGLDKVSLDLSALPAGWEMVGDAAGGPLRLWNLYAEELPEGGVGAHEVMAGRLAYLSPERAGAGYEVADTLWVSGSLAVQQQARMNVRRTLSVESGGRLSNRGQTEVFQGLRNQGRLENRDDGLLVLHGAEGLRNEGELVNSGRITSEAPVVNVAGARFDNPGQLTAPSLRNHGTFVVGGTVTTTSDGVQNTGRVEIARGGRLEAGGGYLQLAGSGDTPVTRVDGALVATAGYVAISEGVLEGTGHVEGSLLLGGDPPDGPQALVRPGGRDAVGTLTADLLGVGRAAFEIDIASATAFDQMAAPLGFWLREGEVHFRLLAGFVPAVGDQFSWLATDPAFLAGIDLGGIHWSVTLLRADQSAWALGGSAGWDPQAPVRFSFDGVQLTVTAVPEPGTALLLLLGLVAVARRRPALRPTAAAGRCAVPSAGGWRTAPSGHWGGR